MSGRGSKELRVGLKGLVSGPASSRERASEPVVRGWMAVGLCALQAAEHVRRRDGYKHFINSKEPQGRLRGH